MKADDATNSSDRLESFGKRVATLSRIIGGLSKTIHTIETRPRK
jgi:hypothetical protein